MDASIVKTEKIHLSKTISKLNDGKKVIENLVSNFAGKNLDVLKDLRSNPETNGADFHFFLEQLHEQNQAFNFKDKYKRLEEIEALLKEPYFARIDLKDTKEIQEIYIGKFGYTEEKPLIIDWRAKIASVFYRYRYPQKNVSYETPDGKQTRDLVVKRTFEIDNGELIKYFNNDIQLDESEIISDKIKKRTGGVLEDIVETIQESQLDIIESDPRQITIVQGCVGSGKSTVAIHKLSHIFFNFPDLIKPERCILIAKNQILVGYLSTLFPKLGIFDIYYKTLKDMVVQILFGENLGIKFDLSIHEDTKDFDLNKLRQFDEEIENIHAQFESQLEKLQESEEFASFSGFRYNTKATPYENISEYIQDLEEELETQQFHLKEHPESPKEWLWKANIKNLKKLIAQLKKIRSTIKEHAFKEASHKFGITSSRLGYSECLQTIYLYSKIIGFSKIKKFDYCVVDEGQDFSLLEYLVMGKFVTNGRFCILGDLNQAYQSDGINSWQDISKAILEASNAQTYVLDTNYRSTKPIIELANSILSPFTKNYLPKSINRKGSDPLFIPTDNVLEKFEAELKIDLKTYKQSIGIICFDQDLMNDATKILTSHMKKDLGRLIVLDKSKKLTYLPNGVYLTKFEDCKGLEFAKVYVLGLDLSKIKTYIDAKKAFVSVTRAMNDLTVIYEKNS